MASTSSTCGDRTQSLLSLSLLQSGQLRTALSRWALRLTCPFAITECSYLYAIHCMHPMINVWQVFRVRHDDKNRSIWDSVWRKYITAETTLPTKTKHIVCIKCQVQNHCRHFCVLCRAHVFMIHAFCVLSAPWSNDDLVTCLIRFP